MEVGIHQHSSSAEVVQVEMSCFRGGYSGESESKGAFVCLVVAARIGELVLD